MKILTLIILILLPAVLFGQVIITGVVKDYHNQETLPFVSVTSDTTVNFKNKSLIKPDTAICNYNGRFDLRRKDKSERRNERRTWRKEGIPNKGGYLNDFLQTLQGKETISIEYPYKHSKKYFQLKEGRLIIDYNEFVKE